MTTTPNIPCPQNFSAFLAHGMLQINWYWLWGRYHSRLNTVPFPVGYWGANIQTSRSDWSTRYIPSANSDFCLVVTCDSFNSMQADVVLHNLENPTSSMKTNLWRFERLEQFCMWGCPICVIGLIVELVELSNIGLNASCTKQEWNLTQIMLTLVKFG